MRPGFQGPVTNSPVIVAEKHRNVKSREEESQQKDIGTLSKNERQSDSEDQDNKTRHYIGISLADRISCPQKMSI